jgi:hypothetical protein
VAAAPLCVEPPPREHTRFLMLKFASEVISHENAVEANVIENRRLEQLQSQLESFNLQATLIVGFSLSTLSPGTIMGLADDTSRFCVYKSPVIAHFYVILASFSIAACMSCIGISFFVVYRSQRAANEISVRHTVALVRRTKTSIMNTYFIGLAAFFASFIIGAFMLFAYVRRPTARPTRTQAPPPTAAPVCVFRRFPNWVEIDLPPTLEGARYVCTKPTGSGVPPESQYTPNCQSSVTAAFDVSGRARQLHLRLCQCLPSHAAPCAVRVAHLAGTCDHRRLGQDVRRVSESVQRSAPPIPKHDRTEHRHLLGELIPHHLWNRVHAVAACAGELPNDAQRGGARGGRCASARRSSAATG